MSTTPLLPPPQDGRGGAVSHRNGGMLSTNTNFTNCTAGASTTSDDRVMNELGGGAIWAKFADTTLDGCRFTGCSGARGGVSVGEGGKQGW